MERITRRIGEIVEFVDNKGYSRLTQEEEKRLLFNTLADCEDKLEDEKNNVMSAILDLETRLCQQTDKPTEIKASMYWGALTVALNSGQIDWNKMRELFGEFISKAMNLR